VKKNKLHIKINSLSNLSQVLLGPNWVLFKLGITKSKAYLDQRQLKMNNGLGALEHRILHRGKQTRTWTSKLAPAEHHMRRILDNSEMFSLIIFDTITHAALIANEKNGYVFTPSMIIEKFRIEGKLSTVTPKKFRSFTMNYNEQATMTPKRKVLQEAAGKGSPSTAQRSLAQPPPGGVEPPACKLLIQSPREGSPLPTFLPARPRTQGVFTSPSNIGGGETEVTESQEQRVLKRKYKHVLKSSEQAVSHCKYDRREKTSKNSYPENEVMAHRPPTYSRCPKMGLAVELLRAAAILLILWHVRGSSDFFEEGKSDKEILDNLLVTTRYDKRLRPTVQDADFCCGMRSPSDTRTLDSSRAAQT
ncbi:hypothetical protein L9F63_021696, partial [Diploptera punctata]